MSDLDEQYLRTRTDTRKWQQDQIAQVMGAGTMQSPSTTMSVDAPEPGKAEGGTQGGTAPKPTGDIGAPITKHVPTRSVGAIEETIPVTGPFAEMVKGADPKGLEDFVNTLGIPAEHLAGAFTKGDITQTATPEEVGGKILSPFQEKLKGLLDEKQMSLLTMATGVLAMAAIDPVNPALAAGKAAKSGEKMVRLFRAEAKPGSVPGSGNISDWLKESPEFKATQAATGRWFTDNKDALKWYQDHVAKNGGTPQVSMIEVPASEAEKYRVKNHPDALPFSRRPDEEFFVDPKHVGKGTPLADQSAIDEAFKHTPTAEEALAILKQRPFKKALEVLKSERGSVPLGGGKEPPIPKGYMRLYRGESAANTKGGDWFTTKKEKAATYGDLTYVDVDPTDRSTMIKFAQGHGGPDEFYALDSSIKQQVKPLLGGGGGGGKKPPSTPALPSLPDDAQGRIDDATKQFRANLKGFTEELNKQRRGVLSDAKVIDLASQRKDATWAALMDLPPGTAVSPELFVAFRDTYKAGAARMKAAAQAVKDNTGNEAAVQELMNAIGETGTATTRMFGLYAEPARTTRLMNKNLPSAGTAETVTKEAESRVKDPFIQQMHDFFKQAEATSNINPSAVTPQRIADMVSALKTDEELAVFANAMAKPGWWDMIMETWINGLLSGPVTHAANIVSNAATLAWGIPERQVAALLSRSVRPGEAAAMMGGVVESIGDAWRVAWKALKEEKPQFGGGKIEDMQKAITADALELTGTAGRAVDFLGAAIRVPGRILMASDDFFKSIAFRAELRALALRKAFQEVNEAGLGGAEAAAKIKEIQRNILANPPESIHDAAQEFAAYVTFTRDLGEAGQKIQGAFAAKLGGVPIGRIILPFIRTPANIFKYAGERTPFALASRAVREEIAAGGERRALALAKISLGSMTMAYVGSLAAGGLITGGGPKDKNVRQLMKDATGWQPYSIKAGDTYISFARIEPLASLLGMGADAADLIGQLTKKDADELAASLVVAVSRNIANKTFVKGLAGTLNAVSSQDVHIVEKFLEKELPTILPFSSALGAIAREMDPIMRSVSSILDAFKAKTPNWSDTLPPQRNIWGEAIALQGGLGPDLISPFYTSAVKADPVSQEIVRLEVPITMPSRQIEGVPLQPDEYDAYVQIAGGKPLIGGKTLHEKLNDIMFVNNALYKKGSDGPDGGKALLVRQWVQDYREEAKQIMQDPEKSMKYIGKKFDDLKTQVGKKRQEQARQFSGAAPGGLTK